VINEENSESSERVTEQLQEILPCRVDKIQKEARDSIPCFLASSIKKAPTFPRSMLSIPWLANQPKNYRSSITLKI
jgi:hypothetical protein